MDGINITTANGSDSNKTGLTRKETKKKKHCFDGGRISMQLYQETVTVGITVEMRTCVAADCEGCHHVRELATRCTTHRESKKKKKTIPLDHIQTTTPIHHCNLGNRPLPYHEK
jgi:hypothetical protein